MHAGVPSVVIRFIFADNTLRQATLVRAGSLWAAKGAGDSTTIEPMCVLGDGAVRCVHTGDWGVRCHTGDVGITLGMGTCHTGDWGVRWRWGHT